MKHDEDHYSRDKAGAADFERYRDFEPPERGDDGELSNEHRDALLDPEIRAMIESCFTDDTTSEEWGANLARYGNGWTD